MQNVRGKPPLSPAGPVAPARTVRGLSRLGTSRAPVRKKLPRRYMLAEVASLRDGEACLANYSNPNCSDPGLFLTAYITVWGLTKESFGIPESSRGAENSPMNFPALLECPKP